MAEVELEVLRIAHGGVAVAELEGRVVFVADTLPGERVRARITDDAHDRFWRAETLEVLRASPDRQQHVWAAAALDRAPEQRAGGAEFGHIAPERQRALKTEVLRDALQRTGGLDPAGLDVAVRAVPGRADGTRSRTRVRLLVDDAGRVRPYAARSRTVVPVADLPLAVEAVEAVLPERATGRALDLVATGGRAFAARRSDPPIVERVGERAFSLEATGFWQVHPAAPRTLQQAVRDALDPAAFDPDADNLDLYGGVGLLAPALGDARVVLLESDRAASGHAAGNLGPRARAVAARVDRFLARPRRRPGATVVLDPPRSGAGAEVVRAIAASEPARIVYVACDPVALARDLRTFSGLGWRPVRLEAFDLFPNTHHLEAVAALAPA
ncbi:class I SAM-dependent RNA methyltransferase [Amnibacterium endophyticum]|uniref:Class I SAM-dependent RNA methyltransferase n=1 Tax=Amnibacterium endophyticum TaxID=2109337 RepID=A0ABW4LDL5_9MICO